MSASLTPEGEFLVAKLSGLLAAFDDAPPAAVLREALVRLRTERPEEVATALPELRAEVLGLVEQGLRSLRGSQGTDKEDCPNV